MSDLAEFTHFVTRVKVVPAVADDVSLSEAERMRGRAFAAQLSMRVLSRTWQMLLKGVGEVQAAGRPVAAAEMVLVRIAYAADLPTPDEVIRSLGEEGAAPARPQGNGGAASTPAAGAEFHARATTRRAARPVPRPRSRRGRPRIRSAEINEPVQAAPTLTIGSFEALIALAQDKRDISMKMALERDVRLVRCEDGQLEIALEPSAPKTLVHDLQRKLDRLDRQALDGGGLAGAGRADGARADGRAAGGARARRAKRSAGAGGAQPLSRRQDRRRDAELRPEPPAKPATLTTTRSADDDD